MHSEYKNYEKMLKRKKAEERKNQLIREAAKCLRIAITKQFVI